MVPKGIDRYRHTPTTAYDGLPSEYLAEDDPAWHGEQKRIIDRGVKEAAHSIATTMVIEEVKQPGTHDIKGPIHPEKY